MDRTGRFKESAVPLATHGSRDCTGSVAVPPKVPWVSIEMKLLKRLGAYACSGALVDLVVFFGSFVFFGGAHGPIGPMIVLAGLNAPVREVTVRIWPMERSSPTFDIVLALAVIVVNGALYGVLVGLVATLWRRARGPKPAP